MSALKENKTCALLEQYLSYLILVKGRSILTAIEYRIDILMTMEFIKTKRKFSEEVKKRDFSNIDIAFIKSIIITDIYDFITYCGQVRKVTTSTSICSQFR